MIVNRRNVMARGPTVISTASQFMGADPAPNGPDWQEPSYMGCGRTA